MPTIQLTTEKYLDIANTDIARSFPERNIFDLPKIAKISINVGVGKYEAKQKQDISDYLYKLTSQKPKHVGTKKAISNFKTRKGDLVGLVVTLRGKKAYDFLLNLVYLSLPKTRDFKGIKIEAFDKNYTTYSLGIENANIFSVVGFDSSVNFGIQINIVFKAPGEDNLQLLKNLNLPFKKN